MFIKLPKNMQLFLFFFFQTIICFKQISYKHTHILIKKCLTFTVIKVYSLFLLSFLQHHVENFLRKISIHAKNFSFY